MSGATAEADDDDLASGIVLLALIVFTVIVDACGAAFIYKVWNERQMTHQYSRQAGAQERIANALERSYPAPGCVAISTTSAGESVCLDRKGRRLRPSFLPVISQPPTPDDCGPAERAPSEYRDDYGVGIYQHTKFRAPVFHAISLPTLGGTALDADVQDRAWDRLVKRLPGRTP